MQGDGAKQGREPQGLGYQVHGDQRGSLPVFERQWQEMLAAEAEPEFGPQERLFAERKIEALLEILPPPPATMLECGCGSAEVSAALAAQGYRATLLDAAPAALQVARRRFARRGLDATYTLGNVYQLPFPDDSFDILTSFGLLEHFADTEKVIAEMVRVIRPGRDVFRRHRPRALLGADNRHGLQCGGAAGLPQPERQPAPRGLRGGTPLQARFLREHLLVGPVSRLHARRRAARHR